MQRELEGFKADAAEAKTDLKHRFVSSENSVVRVGHVAIVRKNGK